MGATYIRQASYTDGDVIQASDTNSEFDQLLAAFAASSGHTHDGTTAEGGPITKMLGTSLTLGDGTAGTDITVTFNGESSDGVLKWMEDEDHFKFEDDIVVDSTKKLYFFDEGDEYIHASANGQLDIVAGTEVQIAATTIDMNGNADISGNLGIGGNLTVTGTTTFNGGTLTLGDADTDNIVFGGEVDSNIIPDDDGTYDLGSSTKEWKDIYIDGVAYLDAINFDGTAITSTAAEINIIDGDATVGTTAIADGDGLIINDAGTMRVSTVQTLAAYLDDEITAMPNLVTTAATTVGALNSGSITSGFGTIDTGSSTITTTGLITGGSLDIDDVVINGTTIGHTDDTDLITVASGIVTVAGEISVTTLDIGGTNVTSTATELNLLDGVSGLVQADFTKLAAVDATATELNIMDGGTSASSTTLADADRVVVNDAGTMKQVALTDFETYFESALDTLSNVTTVGALNSGSITSGFGAIDNGSSAITTTGTVTYGNLSDGSITITAFVDEDNMASNSATLVPTQQSVKAYVDAQVTAQDLDFQGDSGGALNIDLDSETLDIAGGTGIDTSGSGNTLTVAIDSTVTTLTGTQTLTNKTLTTPTITTPVVNTGLQLKNGSTSAGFIEFFEDSDNGTNKVTVIGPASTADVTLTLPNATGTIATGADATALAIALG